MGAEETAPGFPDAWKGDSQVKVTLKISGMHCADCAVTVQKALTSAKGVESAKVSYLKKQADVEVPEGAEIGNLVTAVERAGYKAEPEGATH